ncbi:TetR/AcrR family transcriptional regulator [Millisia brevis]|uniref:TetR/AcrR family transcriptional regulator n=1 Tax=Millisia brevis TaxID=264148 RepID=UPI00083169B3|nr:TetR/AcrR family transcriptional regulator [Millisia brevis]
MPKVSEEHREQRRQQIMRAAVTCFARSGIHTTSMAEVIAESGLSAGAVYLYFRSKDEMIAAVAEDFLQGILATLESSFDVDPPLSPAEIAYALLGRVVGTDERAPLRNLPLLMSVWGEGARDPAIHRLTTFWITDLRRRITDALQRYESAAGLRIPADTLAPAVMALVQGFLIQTALGGNPDLDQYHVAVGALLDPVRSDGAATSSAPPTDSASAADQQSEQPSTAAAGAV